MIVTGFHIEPTNICTLKCPGCARTQFIDKWPSRWKNYNLDINKVMNFLDIDLTDKHINFLFVLIYFIEINFYNINKNSNSNEFFRSVLLQDNFELVIKRQ